MSYKYQNLNDLFLEFSKPKEKDSFNVSIWNYKFEFKKSDFESFMKFGFMRLCANHNHENLYICIQLRRDGQYSFCLEDSGDTLFYFSYSTSPGMDFEMMTYLMLDFKDEVEKEVKMR